MDRTRTVPITALRFDAAPIALAASEADAPRRFDGVAYSGEVIANHYFWGNVVFDLASTRAAERVPILIEHDRKQRAGVGQLAIDQDIRISGTLLSNEHGTAVAAEADAGFPWQMSVHIEPGSVEEVAAGIETTINGRSLTGPLTIFRNGLIRETSFTPTGADSRTSARVFSDTGDIAIPVTPYEALPMSDEFTQRITALEAELASAQAATTTANERAESAEAALTGIKASARAAEVKTLFTAIGREFSEEAAAPFASMTDEQFAATAEMLKASAPQAPAHLFTEQATAGNGTPNPLDHSAIYDARKRGG